MLRVTTAVPSDQTWKQHKRFGSFRDGRCDILTCLRNHISVLHLHYTHVTARSTASLVGSKRSSGAARSIVGVVAVVRVTDGSRRIAYQGMHLSLRFVNGQAFGGCGKGNRRMLIKENLTASYLAVRVKL